LKNIKYPRSRPVSTHCIKIFIIILRPVGNYQQAIVCLHIIIILKQSRRLITCKIKILITMHTSRKEAIISFQVQYTSHLSSFPPFRPRFHPLGLVSTLQASCHQPRYAVHLLYHNGHRRSIHTFYAVFPALYVYFNTKAPLSTACSPLKELTQRLVEKCNVLLLIFSNTRQHFSPFFYTKYLHYLWKWL